MVVAYGREEERKKGKKEGIKGKRSDQTTTYGYLFFVGGVDVTALALSALL